MTKILDKSRAYGVVVGSSDGSAFHQDGLCFNVSGELIGGTETATEEAPPVVDDPKVLPIAQVPTEAPPAAVTRSSLEELHPSQIKKLVVAEGLDYIAGPGSKAKNIDALLAIP